MATKRTHSEMEGEPVDATTVREILDSMGASQHDAAVVPQLIDFMFRHCTNVFKESRVYARHIDPKKDPDIDDLKLAVQTRVNFSFMQPPTREVVLQLTHKRNQVPLPLIQPKLGIRLPPEKHCLTATNFQFNPKPAEKQAERNAATGEAEPMPVGGGGQPGEDRKRFNVKSKTSPIPSMNLDAETRAKYS